MIIAAIVLHIVNKHRSMNVEYVTGSSLCQVNKPAISEMLRLIETAQVFNVFMQ